MIYTDMTKKALKLCFLAHKDQVDKSGMPYVFHPFHLAEQMEDEDTTIVALLHDVVEDTNYTISDLKNIGFPQQVLDAISLMTHDAAEPYLDYVAKLKGNAIARTVKLADLRHNSDLTRLDAVDEKALRRAEKYRKAISILTEGTEDAASTFMHSGIKPENHGLEARFMNMWKSAIMGVVIGDALGCPVQFESRKTVASHPITGMRGHGTFDLPAGSWTDDSSLTLALLESIKRNGNIDYKDIMDNFVKWLDDGEFTPFGYSYDIGRGTMNAINRYRLQHNPHKAGSWDERNNGNGSLMRIMPAVLYCIEKQLPDQEAIDIIHKVGSLTHAHIRANIACGLYFFAAREILANPDDLQSSVQSGLNQGFAFYDEFLSDHDNLEYYGRLRDLSAFAALPSEDISSSGYVVDTLEAAIWSVVTTNSFEEALLKAVNLGDDSDTVGAIAGGLAGLAYGYDRIPEAWLSAIQKREWIEELCDIHIA